VVSADTAGIGVWGLFTTAVKMKVPMPHLKNMTTTIE
jgi:hypothetical protein